ncbi:helix-turn-helix domain-containing protein [Corynebacterium sp. AOP40-9SA-29]|uniref:helix-turn-helix domain-containing protein n=1 Tax=Corynebacterium sp. AOP40-9SA-29 TaxID=3457677 RepID=UPI004033F62E
MWVYVGSMTTRSPSGKELHLHAGEGMWLPEGDRVHWEMRSAPGTVALPLWVRSQDVPNAPAEARKVTIPTLWHAWLIQHFCIQVTPLIGWGHTQRELSRLVLEALPDLAADPPGTNAIAGLLVVPAVPGAPGARVVAEALIEDPSLSYSVEDWASWAATSPRTLRRGFLRDTGSTLEQWRLRCRMISAVGYLIAGSDVDFVYGRVGYTTPSGFLRAFRRYFGAGPGHVLAIVHASGLLRRMVGNGVSGTAPPDLQVTQSKFHSNPHHVLLWMYQGSGFFETREKTVPQPKGTAIFVPAGTEHRSSLEAGAILLPIAFFDAADADIRHPMSATFPPAWDDYLLHCCVTAKGFLRPEDWDRMHVLDLFREQAAAGKERAVPMPTDAAALRVATDYLRTLGTPAVTGGGSAAVSRAFRAETGMTFTRWSSMAKMRLARDSLAKGKSSTSIAHRLGYSSLSSFSRAFQGHHGVSPRQWSQREGYAG